MTLAVEDRQQLSLTLADEAATAALARALAPLLEVGDVVALEGDLGAGKTSFARSLINALPRPGEVLPSAQTEEVPSPTFTLVQIYERDPAPVWHVDLYRLERPDDALELGLEEAFAEAICLIEWPERLGGFLPASALRLRLRHGSRETARLATLSGGDHWADRLRALGAAEAVDG